LTSQYWVLRANISLWAREGDTAIEDAKATLHHALKFARAQDMLDGASMTAMALADAGRYDEAREYVALALAMAERDDVTDSGRSMAHSAAAHVFTSTSELSQAEEHSRASIRHFIAAHGPDDPGLGAPYTELGLVLHQQGKLREAQEQYELALAVREKSLGHWHQQIAQSHHNLSLIYGDSGDEERAEKHSRTALEIATRIFGPKDTRVGQIHNSLAGILDDLGRKEEAAEHFEAALAAFPDPSGINAAHARVNYAQLLDSLGRSDEARGLLERALADQRALVGDEHPEVARTRIAIATFYKEHGLLDEARAEYEAADAFFVGRDQSAHPNRLSALVGRALVERKAGNTARARELLEQAQKAIEDSGQPIPYLLETIEKNLAEL
jgi:tetratricopeptide (TPR) repeat protein